MEGCRISKSLSIIIKKKKKKNMHKKHVSEIERKRGRGKKKIKKTPLPKRSARRCEFLDRFGFYQRERMHEDLVKNTFANNMAA